ncbi:hypothetical protein NDU88_006249 [Pleurodeles waltl]|uniref:Uncharacterized protein n=1 Tax=Pleurodeles waltl TaxID=8319 RepID=A0AAV7NTV6_PLEWA|nr:hypothetical protein NDU88_006249 [Pleurodeles waltl]
MECLSWGGMERFAEKSGVGDFPREERGKEKSGMRKEEEKSQEEEKKIEIPSDQKKKKENQMTQTSVENKEL